MRTRTKNPLEGIKVKGCFRLQITEDTENGPKVVGDSGWHENQVVNLGFQHYLVELLGASANSKQVTHLALGTGGAPAAADTSLAGENATAKRQAVTAAVVASKTQQFTGTFASANSFLTGTKNLSNIGLFNTSTTVTGTIFAGNTFASSAVATNQNVNVTYQIRFS